MQNAELRKIFAEAKINLIKTIPDRRRAGACSRRNERVKINLTFIIKAMV